MTLGSCFFCVILEPGGNNMPNEKRTYGECFKKAEVVSWKHFPLRLNKNEADWVRSISKTQKMSMNKVINSVIANARNSSVNSVEYHRDNGSNDKHE